MLALAVAVLLRGQEPPAPPASGPPPPVSAVEDFVRRFHGRVSARFRQRWDARSTDGDLVELLSLEFNDPSRDAVSGSLSLRLAEDVDGDRGASGANVFDSLDDTYPAAVVAHVFSAYLEVRPGIDGVRLLRGGRQFLDELPEAGAMDGALARLGPVGPVELTLFGGLPSNLYESSSSGDAMGGACAALRPWAGGRVQLDYLHLRDRTRFGDFADDLLGLSVEHVEGRAIFHLRHTLLEFENRETAFRATALVPEADLVLGVSASFLWKRQGAFALALDPYNLFLVDLEPYATGGVNVGVGLGGPFFLDAAAAVRELVGGGAETAYNHAFRRFTVTPRSQGWLHPSLSIAVPLDAWFSSADEFWTMGVDLGWTISKEASLSAGTSFALYTIDELSGVERERVRTTYVALRWRPSAGLELRVRYEFEDSGLGDFHTLTAGAHRDF